MSLFKNFDWSAKSIAKVIGMVLLGILAVTVVIALISFSFRTIFNANYQGENYYGKSIAPQAAYYDEAAVDSFMARGIVPPEPGSGFSTGSDAEAFEVKEYYGTIRTRKLDEICGTLEALKAKTYVVFENANKDRTSCNYSFKVEKDHEEEILQVVKDLKPENLNANVQSIKKSVEGIDKELEILQKKLTSVEETLESAQQAYDDITDLATRKQDVESLATIIDSKLNLIEKLTSEKLNIQSQIDRYQKNKEYQLDRLGYTFFNVNVYEDLFFDWKQIKDSWKFEIQSFVRNVNEVIQDLSVNLVVYVIRFVQVLIYLFISLLLVKFVWVTGKRIWTGKKKR